MPETNSPAINPDSYGKAKTPTFKTKCYPADPGVAFKNSSRSFESIILFDNHFLTILKLSFMAHVTETPTLTNTYNSVVEYSSYDNTYHLRSFLLRKNHEPTALQLAQQDMFIKASEFVLCLSPLLLLSNRTVTKSAHLSFVMSYIFKKAITYNSGEFSVNYRKVLVTRGNLSPAEVALVKTAPGSITFTWTNPIDMDLTRSYDKAIMVVYCEALNKCVYIIGETRRQAEEATLEVPLFHGYEVQTWLSFISADKRNLADSSYTGALFIT
jgi:uncharacterized protein DUF6266